MSALNLLQPGDWLSLYGPFVGLVVIIILAIAWYVREGRNPALEQIVAHSDFGSPTAFAGTLVVEENRIGEFLRLSRSSKESRRLHFWYRWIVGGGPQAIFNEVEFDVARRQVTLAKKVKQTAFAFSEIAAIRMRERKAGKGGISLWYLELVTHKGKAVPFAASASGYRKASFERSAAVAKTAAAIMSVPVQVVVAGNIWTSGWPPKKQASVA